MIRSSKATARRRRAELKVADVVREDVMRRDSRGCRACVAGIPGGGGVDSWAHLEGHRRSQTRRMDPALRHTTYGTMKLCLFHHELEERHRLHVLLLTARGADGPVQFVYQGVTYTEREC